MTNLQTTFIRLLLMPANFLFCGKARNSPSVQITYKLPEQILLASNQSYLSKQLADKYPFEQVLLLPDFSGRFKVRFLIQKVIFYTYLFSQFFFSFSIIIYLSNLRTSYLCSTPGLILLPGLELP